MHKSDEFYFYIQIAYQENLRKIVSSQTLHHPVKSAVREPGSR